MKKVFIFYFTALGIYSLNAQTFTRADSLRGGLRPERTCFDVMKYGLNITLNPDKKYIYGYNDIAFRIVHKTKKIQLDLYENMQVDSIICSGRKLSYTRDNGAVFVSFPKLLNPKQPVHLRFYYSGYPKIAAHAPWDGGFVFSNDASGKPWIAVAVQGAGASLWFPVKDTQTDEPDNGADISIAVPNGLMDVSNGRLVSSEDLGNGYTRWNWKVLNPINNYDITLNVADYAHIQDSLNGLSLDYYVLKENIEKAKKQFTDVKPMLECFQQKFGQYPFYEDGYKLVETPYLGMEHQSAVAYGNKYLKGYLGMDRTGTGIGLLFDFIIIHESGHEWFGNSITSADVADMWIHEAFTTYAEAVFVECQYGTEKALQYVNGEKRNVINDKPIIGQYGVSNEGSSDMYDKGALMLNTIRHIINDDDKWWAILKNFAETYRKKIIDTETVVNFFNKESGLNLTPVFNQYLRYTHIPVLQLRKSGKTIEYRWQTDEPGFTMPVMLKINDNTMRIQGTNNWQSITAKAELSEVIPDTMGFYIKVEKL